MLIKNYKRIPYEGVDDKRILLFNLVLRIKLFENTKSQLSAEISKLLDVCDISIKGKGLIASFDCLSDVYIIPQRNSKIDDVRSHNLNKGLDFLYSDKNQVSIKYNSTKYNIIYEYPYGNKKIEELID